MKNCNCIHLACQKCNKIEKFTNPTYHDEEWTRDCPEIDNEHNYCELCSF